MILGLPLLKSPPSIEHLIPDSTTTACRFCGATRSSEDRAIVPPRLLATARRVFLLSFNCLNDARKLRARLPAPTCSFEEALGASGGGENALLLATVNRECAAGAARIPSIAEASVLGLNHKGHVCKGGVSCVSHTPQTPLPLLRFLRLFLTLLVSFFICVFSPVQTDPFIKCPSIYLLLLLYLLPFLVLVRKLNNY